MKHPLLALLPVLLLIACEPRGTLELTVMDPASGEPTPARVELVAASGESIVPQDALPVAGDCGSIPVHNWVPAVSRIQTLRNRDREVRNPYTASTQFYSDGSNRVRLEPGCYVATATKGIEYEQARAEFVIEQGRVERVEMELLRWVNLPAEGWYGADDHLHIARPHARFDPSIATWMQAEDIHVANLLQMGLARDVHITPQHGFGRTSVYRAGDTLVASGQENPRTHVLGHSIVLGARHWLDDPSSYLLYDHLWRTSHEHGGVNGYAHWGLAGAEEGLALWGHEQLLDFIEVLGFGLPFYDRWYEALNLGIRLSLTAGTDYPCSPSLPGRERFYARLDGPLNYDAWLAAVRRGNTFVTNGPVLDFRVEGTGPGEEIRLEKPTSLTIRGRVRFDPARDAVARLELIRGGEVIRRVEQASAAGELRMETTVDVDRSSWFALRASGHKRDETMIDTSKLMSSMLVLERDTNDDLLASLPAGATRRASAAHTGAVWVTVEGSTSLARQPKAGEVAQSWLARLDELEHRFGDDRIAELAGFPGRGDGVDEALLRNNRRALVEAIEAARDHLANRKR